MKGYTVMHVYIKYVLMGNTGLMVIRRGDISDIGWVFVGLEMNALYLYHLEELLIMCHHYITQLGVLTSHKPLSSSLTSGQQ